MIAAIQVADYWLVAGLVGVAALITYFLSSIYYAQRVYDMHRHHVDEMQAYNTELMAMQQSVIDTKMQARVMGSVPVSRLIGDDD
jgi:hypothetical protein